MAGDIEQLQRGLQADDEIDDAPEEVCDDAGSPRRPLLLHCACNEHTKEPVRDVLWITEVGMEDGPGDQNKTRDEHAKLTDDTSKKASIHQNTVYISQQHSPSRMYAILAEA